MPIAAIHQAFADIAAGSDVHAQPVARVLMDDAPGRAHQAAALLLGDRVDIERLRAAPEQHFALVGFVDAGEAAQQGRLARAGFADDAEHLARPEVEGDIGAADALAIEAADAVDGEQGGGFERELGRCDMQGHGVVSSTRPLAAASPSMVPRWPSARRISQ